MEFIRKKGGEMGQCYTWWTYEYVPYGKKKNGKAIKKEKKINNYRYTYAF